MVPLGIYGLWIGLLLALFIIAAARLAQLTLSTANTRCSSKLPSIFVQNKEYILDNYGTASGSTHIKLQ
jgi:hypothetical protein